MKRYLWGRVKIMLPGNEPVYFNANDAGNKYYLVWSSLYFFPEVSQIHSRGGEYETIRFKINDGGFRDNSFLVHHDGGSE